MAKYWGDPSVDWEGIDKAAYFIGTNLRRFGRIHVSDMKEKYGEVRVYCNFSRHELMYKYQACIYRTVYAIAIYRWPHLEDSIIEGADYPELLANKLW